jgi:hypothetical protein
MVSNRRTFGRLALIPALALALGPVLTAQETEQKRAFVEIGFRTLAGDRDSSQFDRYRDITPGLYIQQASLDLDHLFNSTYYLNFQTRQSWQNDQQFLGRFGKYGKLGCEVSRFGTPHDFTASSVTMYTESSPGYFTVPAAVRAQLVSAPSSLNQVLGGAKAVDIALRRHLTGGGCEFRPNGSWTLFTNYSHDDESGYRPLGTTLNDESQVLEQMEPIQYRTDTVTAGAQYFSHRLAFEGGYGASFFNNDRPTLRWDNPFIATNATGSGSQGQMALYPGNQTQDMTFAAAWNIGKFTRLMVSVSPEWMRQNQAFLPFTVNNAVTGVPALPATSLNGKKTTIASNITITSRPFQHLSLKAQYRDFDYINNTPSLFFSNYVYTDRQLANVARQSLPYGFNQQSLGTSASWLFHKGESLTASY